MDRGRRGTRRESLLLALALACLACSAAVLDVLAPLGGTSAGAQSVIVAVASPSPSTARTTLADGTVVILGPNGSTIAAIAPAIGISPEPVHTTAAPATHSSPKPVDEGSDIGADLLAAAAALACGVLVVLVTRRRWRDRTPTHRR